MVYERFIRGLSRFMKNLIGFSNKMHHELSNAPTPKSFEQKLAENETLTSKRYISSVKRTISPEVARREIENILNKNISKI